MSHHEVTFGLDTFGDVTDGPDGWRQHPAQVIRDVVDQGVHDGPAGAAIRPQPEPSSWYDLHDLGQADVNAIDCRYDGRIGPVDVDGLHRGTTGGHREGRTCDGDRDVAESVESNTMSTAVVAPAIARRAGPRLISVPASPRRTTRIPLGGS